jgi:uncharacterized protein YjiK
MKRPVIIIATSLTLFALTIFMIFFVFAKKVKPVEYYDILVPEPSGLIFSADGKGFWTVSDRTGEVAQISFSGQLIKKFTLKEVDFEAITLLNDTVLVLAREGKHSIMFVTTNGEVLRDEEFDIGKKSNSGIEGLAYVPQEDIFILAQEKKPRRLIEIDAKTFEVKKEIKLGKEFPDVSDIYYDAPSNQLWILSDQGEFAARCNREGQIIKKHKLKVEKLEGICVDPKKRKIYTVSDKLAGMFIFDY